MIQFTAKLIITYTDNLTEERDKKRRDAKGLVSFKEQQSGQHLDVTVISTVDT